MVKPAWKLIFLSFLMFFFLSPFFFTSKVEAGPYCKGTKTVKHIFANCKKKISFWPYFYYCSTYSNTQTRTCYLRGSKCAVQQLLQYCAIVNYWTCEVKTIFQYPSCTTYYPSCRCGGWYNSSCGAYGCPSYRRGQIQYCYWSPGGGLCDTNTRCAADNNCRSCSCGGWNNSSCGAYGCPSTKRGQIQYCYWNDGSGLCDTNTRCVNDSSCQGAVLPDCGHTCVNHGTASSAWPDCSCTNRSPASGYTRIGTWNSSDCSQCTGYRRVSVPTPTPTRRPTPTPTPRPTNTPTPTPTATPTPIPSCTVSLSPGSLTLAISKSDLITANVTLQNATVSKVDFSSSDSNIASIDPTTDSDSPYRTQVTGVNVGEVQVNASVTLSPSGSCSTATPANISVEQGGWFQTQGGTIHAEGNLSDEIPATAANRNLSVAVGGFPGVVSHQSSTEANFGEGYPSNDDASHWLAKSSYQGKNFSSWDFFEKKYSAEMENEDFDGTLPGADGIYYSSSNKTLQGSWNVPADRWILVLVDGDITVPGDISLPEGSFLGIVSSGDINFAGTVLQVEGIFIANNSINTGIGNTQFRGEGFFAAAQFLLRRDLDDSNPTTPAEVFTFRPDFLINSYRDTDYNLWWLEFRWEEIAP